MKRSLALSLTALVALTGTVGTAQAQTAGTGSVTTTVVGTTLGGGVLSLAGTGVALVPNGTPGQFVTGASVTALTVQDLTGTDNGWAITATYAAPDAGQGIGGQNIMVSAGDVVPNVLGGVLASQVSTVTDQLLDAPVKVASTGDNPGSGITALTSSLKVRLPVTAKVGNVFGGKVVYTVASVR